MNKKEYLKEWNKKNAEHLKEYRKNNSENIKKRMRIWREKHPNYSKIKSKEWRQNNSGYRNEYQKEYRKTHLKLYKKLDKKNYIKSREKGARRAIQIIARAIKNKKLLSLTENYVLCVDCGIKRAKHYEHRDYNQPLNVQPVCASCNQKRGSAIFFNK